MSRYDFLVETYATERIKTLSVWSDFFDEDLLIRPNPNDPRGRNLLEQMIHQCISENLWFINMLEIDVNAPPLPKNETRNDFILRYSEDSKKRLETLKQKDDHWWETTTSFFNVQRTRAWVLVRRMNHSTHHRGQLTYLLRMLGRDLHSTYGPTADTGGLFINKAPTIYAYDSEDSLICGLESGGTRAPLPGSDCKPITERPAG